MSYKYNMKNEVSHMLHQNEDQCMYLLPKPASFPRKQWTYWVTIIKNITFQNNFQEGEYRDRQLKLSVFFEHSPKTSGHFPLCQCFFKKDNLVFFTEKVNGVSNLQVTNICLNRSFLVFFSFGSKGGRWWGEEEWSRAEAWEVHVHIG